MANALRVAVMGREYATQGSLKNTWPWQATMHSSHRRNNTILPEWRIQSTWKCEQQCNPLLENKSNDRNSNPDNHCSVRKPIATQCNPEHFQARLGFSDPEETRVWHGHDSTKNPLLPPQCVLMDLLQKSLHSVSLITAYASGNLARNESDTMKPGNQIDAKSGRDNWELGSSRLSASWRTHHMPQQKIEKQKLFDDIKQEILALSEA